MQTSFQTPFPPPPRGDILRVYAHPAVPLQALPLSSSNWTLLESFQDKGKVFGFFSFRLQPRAEQNFPSKQLCSMALLFPELWNSLLCWMSDPGTCLEFLFHCAAPTWDLFIYTQLSAEKGLFPDNTLIRLPYFTHSYPAIVMPGDMLLSIF